ncbi:uncharacterized [Tachysurus ichikawai]
MTCGRQQQSVLDLEFVCDFAFVSAEKGCTVEALGTKETRAEPGCTWVAGLNVLA